MLKTLLEGKKIILASSSPRRKQLLEGLDIEFTVEENGNVSEQFDPNMDLYKIPEHLALLKSKGFKRKLNYNELLVTADTMVICNNEIMGKPKDRSDAFKMLQKLSGNRHTVLTGVCMRNNYKIRSFTSSTDVFFRQIIDEEIEYYIDNYPPYDKAGAYGAQDWIGLVAIERIDGSFFNVMGLPVQKLYTEMERFLSDN
ncbi:MAG: septum formation protein Maf [Bacteroidales bacterium]|jgi:septum formation protein|nr:septum formation protein Maf [Bacteroidales bacterium]